MKIKIILTAALATLAIGLAGCTANTENASGTTTASSTVASKTAKDYVDGLDARSLDVANVKEIDVKTLDSKVAATNGVSFTGESDVAMLVLQFKSQDDAMTAQTYYMDQDKKTHANQGLLFVADRDLGQDWFAKYQKGLFQQ